MKKTISIALILFLLFLSGCQQESKQEITIGTWKTAQTIQPFLYSDYLTDNYTIEVLPFTNPGDQKAALLSGELDLCGTTLVTAIIAASKKEPIQIVCNLANKCSALVVRSDSNINNIDDLKGKTIAYVPGTMHHILLLNALKNAGLNPDSDVTLTRVDFFDMGQALATKAVDAYCSGEPFPSIAVSEGYGKILSYPYFNDNIGSINAVMITTKSQTEKYPDKIQTLVTAHKDATKYLIDNKEQWIQKASKFGTATNVLQLAAPNMDIAWDIPQEMIIQTENLANEMLVLGIIEEVPDIAGMFDLTFINKIKQSGD